MPSIEIHKGLAATCDLVKCDPLVSTIRNLKVPE